MDDELTTINCFVCHGGGGNGSGFDGKCLTCQGTGRVFWVDGRAVAYTPEGEKIAKRLHPVKCADCGENYADPPSRLCPGCEAYREHQS